MTHEPDATNEGKYATGGIVNNPFLVPHVGGQCPEMYLFPDGRVEFNEAALRRQRLSTDTRFTYDGTQSDPGDEHKERV